MDSVRTYFFSKLWIGGLKQNKMPGKEVLAIDTLVPTVEIASGDTLDEDEVDQAFSCWEMYFPECSPMHRGRESNIAWTQREAYLKHLEEQDLADMASCLSDPEIDLLIGDLNSHL